MVYTFGACRLDLHARTLEFEEEARHLSPKAFELLRLLLEARPRVLAKAELMDRLWPETFVSDANLPVLIGEIRVALGDEARDSRIVKTHHTVGYSFIAAVHEVRAPYEPGASLPPMFVVFDDRRIPLREGANEVGRDIECHIRLTDLSVSKRHARIVATAAGVTVEDLESKNGTKVDGVRISGATPLADSAVVHFGSVETSFVVVREQEVSTQTLPNPD